jgi:hypothetical protein
MSAGLNLEIMLREVFLAEEINFLLQVAVSPAYFNVTDSYKEYFECENHL